MNLLLNTDNTLKVSVLDEKSGTSLAGATVTYSLKDSGGTIDSGVCAYDSTELVDDSTYYVFYGNVADTISLTENDSYTALITINAGAGLQREIKSTVTAVQG